jgi:transcriptional regulator with XRE-family HTH domain
MKKLNKVKAAQFDKGMTLKDLSDASGICRSYLSQAMHGRLILTDDEKRRLARALGRTVEELELND